MSADKPTGGDGFPDRFSGDQDRPFPGAPENREPAPEPPKNTISMEELSAIYQRSNSLAELQAAAKAYEEAQAREAGSSDSPGSGSPDSAPAGEGPAAIARDGTDAVGGRHPEELPQAEGFTRPDSDLPPFPGAPEDREPAPELPKNTISMEELSAIHQRSNSSAELEAMAPEYAAAAKDASASKLGGGQETGGTDGFSGRIEGARHSDAAESGEQDSDDLGGGSSRTSADSSQQAQHGKEPGREKELEGQDEEFQEQKPNDQPRERDQKPDANPVQPDETGPEASPDAHPDDQRPLTVADAKALIAEALAENNAKHEAELDEQNAKHEAETEELKAGYESRLSALEAKAEDSQEDQADEQLPGDGTPEDETRPDAPDASDERGAEQRGDRLQRGTKEPEQRPDEPDSSQEQGAELDGHVESDEQAAEKQPESSRLRRVFTAENIGATGTIAGAINTAAMTGIHMTPDGLVGLGVTILGIAALGVGKLEKRRKEKDERPN